MGVVLVNMFNKYVMNDVTRIFDINSNINKIAKNISCFILVGPTSVIYKEKASIEQILRKACMFHFFAPSCTERTDKFF